MPERGSCSLWQTRLYGHLLLVFPYGHLATASGGSHIESGITKGAHIVNMYDAVGVAHEQLMRENPSIALKDLPEQCGYATTGTFVRNFKRCHNMSPSEFMNKLLIEQTLPKVEKTFQ